MPGPGIAVILLGLVVLSAEFQWARRVLAWFRGRFTDLKGFDPESFRKFSYVYPDRRIEDLEQKS